MKSINNSQRGLINLKFQPLAVNKVDNDPFTATIDTTKDSKLSIADKLISNKRDYDNSK